MVLGPEGDGLAFSIAGDPARLWWERDPVAMSADDALAVENEAGRHEKPGPDPEARNAAAEWLRDLLRAGATPAAKVKDEAKGAEYGWRTVQRAAETIGVIRHKCSFGGGWTWELPPEDANRRRQLPQEPGNLASWHLRENDPENAVSVCQDTEHAKSPHLGTFDGGDGRERGAI